MFAMFVWPEWRANRQFAPTTCVVLAKEVAGPAPADAEKAGRFGLLNMAQRAEQIGAILDVKRWPTGGTHVALEWRPR